MSTPPNSRQSTPLDPAKAMGENSDERRIFAMLAYVLPVVGGVIGLAVDKANPLTRVHAQQSIAAVLLLIISFLIWAAAGWLIGLIPFVGPILALALFSQVIAMAIFLAANWIASLVVAARGQERQIPFANRLVTRLFGEAEKTKPAGSSV